MKQMTLIRSLPYFFIPSALMLLAIFLTISFFDRIGVPLVINFPLHFCALLGGLGVAALVLGAREKLADGSLWQRLWLTNFRLSDVLIGLVAGGLGLWAYLQLQFTVPVLMEAGPFGPPDILLRLFSQGRFLDVPLAGAWWLLGVFLLIFLCNVVGEELWWRGYVLPRQHAALGSIAWLPHALLWTAFHIFFYWDWVALLPIAILISIACQWRRSAWTGIFAHGVLNGIGGINLWQGIAAG